MSQVHYNRKRNMYAHRIGQWLPNDQKDIKKWLDKLIEDMKNEYCIQTNQSRSLVTFDGNTFVGQKHAVDPLIQKFWSLIDEDPTLHMQYTQMFTEVTKSNAPGGSRQVHSYQMMFVLVNRIMKSWAPEFGEFGLVGFPINVILNWSMGTVNGYAAFLNDEANDFWKQVLNKWGEFLKSPDSCKVLVDTPGGWFSEEALAKMPNFANEFKFEPQQPHYGYTSWDNFFTRQFKPGVRPVAFPGDMNVICNACESLPYNLQYNVSLRDEFWIKAQPYSLRHILNEDEHCPKFVNGTVYQAFLNALSYHRWHSPVDGKVIKAYNIPGTYYSATLCADEDESSPDKSQGYICQVAARAVIFIEASNHAIGLMCFVAVGMSEVSSCEINPDILPVDGPKQVTKGQEIGMFHYGGSTHCLIFRPEVSLEFDKAVLDSFMEPNPENIKVNAKLATVVTESN